MAGVAGGGGLGVVLGFQAGVVDAEGGPDSLKVRWQQYLDSLVTHEAGHRANAVQAGAEIERTLPMLAAQATCEEMERLANEEGHKLLAKFRACLAHSPRPISEAQAAALAETILRLEDVADVGVALGAVLSA